MDFEVCRSESSNAQRDHARKAMGSRKLCRRNLVDCVSCFELSHGLHFLKSRNYLSPFILCRQAAPGDGPATVSTATET